MSRVLLLLAVPLLLAQRQPDLILRTSTLLDGRGGVQRGASIVIDEGKIVSVGHARAIPGVPEIDLRGLTVTPGWIDTHVHISWHFDKSGRLAGASEPPQQTMLAAVANAWAA